jgi:hypothetical protein
MVQSFVETAKPHEVLDAMRIVSLCRVPVQALQEARMYGRLETRITRGKIGI